MRRTRTYLASLGSGASLLGAAVAVFAVLGAVVAFDGLPTSSASSEDGTILVDTNAPEAAGLAAADPGAAPAAIAPTAALAAVAAPAPAAAPAPVPGPGSTLPLIPTQPGGGGDGGGGGGGGGGDPGPVDGGPLDQITEPLEEASGLDLGPITGPLGEVIDDITGGIGSGLP